MYTWGYIKDVSLAKLDLDETEATTLNLLSRFPFYANEVITQISSSIKPKCTFAEFTISKDDLSKDYYMPDDFISYNDEVCKKITYEYGDKYISECTDLDLIKMHNKINFAKPGKYYIPYNARWIVFTKDMKNDEKLNIPYDILDCIPSYIAHQCYKIDDENKSTIFRNEYELFLARIDNSDYGHTGTIRIGGDW